VQGRQRHLGHHHGGQLLREVGTPGGGAEGAAAVAGKLRTALHAPLTLDLDGSIGIAVYPTTATTPPT
jgi:hypothetical protein